ncbi:hypothetical protein BHE74_00057385 [Ensete ventricosum]|nr:hypothetical protein BHE74_00057385 [Ensete ventricosum]
MDMSSRGRTSRCLNLSSPHAHSRRPSFRVVVPFSFVSILASSLPGADHVVDEVGVSCSVVPPRSGPLAPPTRPGAAPRPPPYALRRKRRRWLFPPCRPASDRKSRMTSPRRLLPSSLPNSDLVLSAVVVTHRPQLRL